MVQSLLMQTYHAKVLTNQRWQLAIKNIENQAACVTGNAIGQFTENTKNQAACVTGNVMGQFTENQAAGVTGNLIGQFTENQAAGII